MQALWAETSVQQHVQAGRPMSPWQSPLFCPGCLARNWWSSSNLLYPRAPLLYKLENPDKHPMHLQISPEPTSTFWIRQTECAEDAMMNTVP